MNNALELVYWCNYHEFICKLICRYLFYLECSTDYFHAMQLYEEI